MQNTPIRIGTRESQLAVWQANLVKSLLEKNGVAAELVYIKSDGDIDLSTPLYAMGVQGVFTRSLDIALLDGRIDIAVHSMKDVPVQLPHGIVQAAVLKRGSYKDILVLAPSLLKRESRDTLLRDGSIIATSSIRRKAQWLNKYPNSIIENLRGNVNTRLRKLRENNWNGAIFAAAGLERINLRPKNSIELNWMLPAPAQGTIMVVSRAQDENILNVCEPLNDNETSTCVKSERDFLKALMGGCSTPISALAEIKNDKILFQGNIVSQNGKLKAAVKKWFNLSDANEIGEMTAKYILENGGEEILDNLKHGS